MSTDEFSQDMPEEVYVHRAPSDASTSYANLGDASNCSLPMTGNLDLNAMASMPIRGQMTTLPQDQDLSTMQRQKRKYTRRKNPEERKRRGPRTKDMNAPRMPLNGYVRFLNANRDRIKQENPELNFAEVTKRLAAEWSSMSAEEKKAYLDEAEKAKEIYLKELHEYQQTESYQEFQEMKQRSRQQQPPPQPVPLMTSSSQNQLYRTGQNSQYFNDHINQYPMYNQQQQMYQQQHQSYSAYNLNGNRLNASSGCYPPYYGNTMIPSSGYSYPPHHQRVCNYPGAIPTQNILNGDYNHSQLPSNTANNIDLQDSIQENGSTGNSLQSVLQRNTVVDLPIFTEEFLEHNKLREQDLRNLRAFTMEYEEANAISSKHVDDMLKACEVLAEQEQKERTTHERLKTILELLQQNLITKMSHLTIPRYLLVNSDKSNFDETISSDSASPGEIIGPPTIDTFELFISCLNKLSLNQSIQQCKSSEPLLESIRGVIISLDDIAH